MKRNTSCRCHRDGMARIGVVGLLQAVNRASLASRVSQAWYGSGVCLMAILLKLAARKREKRSSIMRNG